ncbi:Sec-independent protein translocase subunit TatA [Gordonia bronchialis]|jgi:sec-independent protein translocase protein TatA|uniref:Sec-independent protein translocase subunit TatA n=1 Tax=Gordonia bronchialis TaxID=2054 RepID=UPI00242C85DD|nr:Sec-independent protein translocase subunit TatA [Gordonia bronchialis]
MFNAVQPWHLVVLVIVLLVLFGSKKLPDAARGLGRSLRIFKSEIKEMQKDEEPDTTEAAKEAQRTLPAGAEDSAARKSTAPNDDVKKSA